MRFFREDLAAQRVIPCSGLRGLRNGRRVSVGGLVLVRQRPGTANGVVFVTLEDETGIANLVCWKDIFETNRRLVMSASFLVVHGRVQEAEGVIHVVAESFTDLSWKLGAMRDEEAPTGDPPPRIHSRVTGRLVRSRDFH